eukprot:m.10828 g.10828  ORF g.10828 m.10828 type:complete len:790 (+) comp3862_c0_seq2:243-2612(+)
MASSGVSLSGAGAGRSDGEAKMLWREQVLFVYDQSYCQSEEDNPDDAVVVFLAPAEIEVNTQTFLSSGLVGVSSFASGIAGTKLSGAVFCLGTACKVAVRHVGGSYTVGISGSLAEPDVSLRSSLAQLLDAFVFFHGSFDNVKEQAGNERKRFSASLTRIWTSLFGYYRPPRDSLQAAFSAVPYMEMPQGTNRHFAVASQIVASVQASGVLGAAVLHANAAIISQMPSQILKHVLAMLQPSQPNGFFEQDNTRLRRRGLKIREMMLRGPNKIIRTRELYQRSYPNCFRGNDFVDLLLDKAEVRSRAAGVALGRRLLQAGVFHHVINDNDFRDESKFYYRFRVDEEAVGRSGGGAGKLHGGGTPRPAVIRAGPHGDVRNRVVDLRPLVLTSHGRDARRIQARRGLSLPAGVHLVPVFVADKQCDELRAACPIRSTGGPVLEASMYGASGAGGTTGDDSSLGGGGDSSDIGSGPASNRSSWMDDDCTPFDEYLEGTRLAPYRAFLEASGLGSTTALRTCLETMSSDSLDELLGHFVDSIEADFAFDGDRGDQELREQRLQFKHALASAATVAHEAATHRQQQRISVHTVPRGCTKLGLLLHGLGDTVLAVLVDTAHLKDQPLLSGIAAAAGPQLVALEQSICQTKLDDGWVFPDSAPVAIPPEVEAYNHVAYSSVSASLKGWSNSHWSAPPEQRLVPDTDVDKAFTEAVADMHDTFQDKEFASMGEMVLRKNLTSAVYGKVFFGQEVYFQFRSPLTNPRLRNDSRPFDADVAELPSRAKERLRADRKIPFL